jgi:diguanylate cyclase (GGDEF)-like protein/PAS domain S-box-containing protein
LKFVFDKLSIKARVTLSALGIFVLSIWALSFYASRMLQDDIQRAAGEQQFSTVSFIAADVNGELTDRVKALENIAGRISPATLHDTPTLQKFIEDRVTLQLMFNGGLIVTGADGTAIADVPLSTGRIGVNYSDSGHVAATLREGKTTIGKPILGKKLGVPIFTIVAPIRNAQGGVIGALLGVTDLGKPNFLDKLTQSHYGKMGGYILVSIADRLVITATDKSRIMQPLAPPGLIPQTDRFLEGFEGYAVYVNARGQEVLNASKRIALANWNVAATLPTAEAFAPVRVMQQRMLLVTLFLTLLAGALNWWTVRRQLAPMLTTVKRLATLSESDQNLQPLPITRQDEIGDLIGGFNRLLGILGRQKKALMESEFRWKYAIEGSGDGLWDWNVTDSTVFFSKAWKEMLGHSEDEVGSGLKEWEKRIHPDDKVDTLAAVQAYLDGKTPIYVSEHRVRCKDGNYKWILDRGMVVNRDEDGKPLRLIGTHEDIPERKRLEEQIRHLAFYDPLTKLPNRRLLLDRMNQAMIANKRSGHFGALMFLDLDNFKPLNDTHGHEAGDLLLMEVARRLTNCVREIDTVSRFGGDEFVVVMSDLAANKTESTKQAGIVAEKIRFTLSEPYLLTIKHVGKADTTVEHHCTASIGAVVFADREASQDDLLKWADAAMYQAKDAGRNAIRFCGVEDQN